MSTVSYRSDIDGLRAIAVLSVVFYHFGIPGFSGGYVGVDIFFAISGYLIGSIVHKQLTANNFSFSNFYLRRIKRLFPAYLITILFSTALGYWLLLPNDFKEFGQSIVASTAYVSNIFFYMKTGYFDTASHLKPLLHTWSLAVEEQFYLLFPLIAWLCVKFFRNWLFPALATLCLASFISAILFIDYDQSAAFYLYPFRAWEMFIGVLLAIKPPKFTVTSTSANFLSCLGLALMLIPITVYDNSTLFPGLAALPPTLGALLIIFTGSFQQSPVTHILSTRPFVFFGKISYSLYLWHWPLFVFYNYSLNDQSSPSNILILLLTTIIAATLSWKYIETPFRSTNIIWLNRTKPLFYTTALASLICIGTGFYIHITNGLPSRLPTDLAKLASISNGFNSDWEHCKTQDNESFPGLEHCAIGEPESSDNVLLIWGDSHALSLKAGLKEMAKKYDQDILIIWRGGCPPVLGIEKEETSSSRIEDRKCAEQNASTLELIIANKSIKAIVLVGRWSYYINGGGVGIDKHNKILIKEKNQTADTIADNQQDIFISYFSKTISTLKNNNLEVFIIEQPPEFSDYHSRNIARKLKIGRADYSETIQLFTNVKYSTIIDRQKAMLDYMSQYQKTQTTVLLPTHPYFCNNLNCSVLINNTPAYYDNNHISADASIAISNIFIPTMEYMQKVKSSARKN